MKNTLIVAFCFLLTGCAARMARFDINTNERQQKPITPVLSGVVEGTGQLAITLSSPITGWFIDDIPPWIIVLAPFQIIDLPFSLVADVFYIPSDIKFMIEYKKSDQEARAVPDPHRLSDLNP
jgi:uncharacterized protein YceK